MTPLPRCPEADHPLVEGIERAVFGAVPAAEVDRWLQRHVRSRLSLDVAEVLFRTGRVSAVYGLRLSDGSRVVVKVHRGAPDAAALGAAVAAQSLLASVGYPCPAPVDGPASTDGRTAVVESLLDAGEAGDAHEAPTRRAMARSLAEQVDLLRSLPASVRQALTDPPAWAVYQHGPWPTPHDPIFDFTTTPPEHAWLDRLAREAADVLTRPAARAGAEPVTGHSDWYCGNLRFAGGAVVAAYDWDSVVTDTEPVVAGMAGASFPDSSLAGPQAPTPEEATAFLAEYDACRAAPFTAAEQVTAAAAVTWTMAYNARCLIDVERLGFDVPEGSTLEALQHHGHEHLALRW